MLGLGEEGSLWDKTGRSSENVKPAKQNWKVVLALDLVLKS